MYLPLFVNIRERELWFLVNLACAATLRVTSFEWTQKWKPSVALKVENFLYFEESSKTRPTCLSGMEGCKIDPRVEKIVSLNFDSKD